ncbi:MAG: 50S ribosomal protein L18 [Pyrinomonadaceae bacterium]
MASTSRAEIRKGVHTRIRKKVSGTAEQPRLAVYRSLNHIYAQIIDDKNGNTLAAASTTESDLKGSTGGNIEAAQRVGKAIAERAQAAGIANVVYDRGGYVYHGRVKALIDATREAGLNKKADSDVSEEKKESNEE